MSALLTAAAGAAAPSQPASATRVQFAQVTIEQRVIIRIPTVRPPSPQQRGAALSAPVPPAPAEVTSFKEVKGPKCLKLDEIRGALINMNSGVTMLTERDEAFRPRFGKNCRTADFYAGFYVEPTKDKSICAGRDVLHARNGSICEIEGFSKLVPDD